LTFPRSGVTVAHAAARVPAGSLMNWPLSGSWASLTTILCAALFACGVVQPRPATATEALNVVVTIPVLKDLADRVGGPHVQVVSLLSGYESEHTYSPKPSDVIAVSRSRILLEIGLGLEVWVSSLVKSAGNKDLLVVTTSKGIGLLREHDARDESNRTADSRSRLGNPHVWLDPENAKVMMRHITDAFSAVDPSHTEDYHKNQAAYLVELDHLQGELTERVRTLPDRRIVVHHPAWPYFARRFGFKIVGEIVNQPGSEPSGRHLQRLIQRIRNDRVRVIVSEPQLNQKLPEMVAREGGARVVPLGRSGHGRRSRPAITRRARTTCSRPAGSPASSGRRHRRPRILGDLARRRREQRSRVRGSRPDRRGKELHS
jgi:ABC-type Zn uptake system ZnuABC Zn-binding protein ZnuA